MEYLFLDTETGGLDPDKHSLLQVGLVAYKDNRIKDKCEFSIKEKEYSIDANALRFNGLNLYEDIYRYGLDKKEAVERIISFINRNFDDIPILVGHNPSLDKYMIRKLFSNQDLNMDDYISHRMIDTMSLIWGLHISGKIPSEACSSSGAFSHFGIKVEKRHHALDDCVATVELFENLINLMKE